MGAPLLLLAFVAGLLVAPFLSPAPLLHLAPFVTGAAWLFLRKSRLSLPILLAFFALLGLSRYHFDLSPPEAADHIASFASKGPLTVEGRASSVSRRPKGRTVVDLEATRVFSEEAAFETRGKMRLYIGGGSTSLRPGDRFRFHSRLRPLRAYGTPGEFDFRRHLAFERIFVTAYLPEARSIAAFAAVEEKLSVEKIRTKIVDTVDGSVEPALAPLVRALTVGDKGGIGRAERELLGRGGVSHLFAISGLHLGLAAFLLYLLLRALYLRSEFLIDLAPPKRYLPLLISPLLFGYLLLTGDALSTRRAFLMITAGALLYCISRRTPPLRLLSAAAFLLLLLEPLAFYRAAFQLSFAGVLGILVLLPRWKRFSPEGPPPLRALSQLFFVTLAATLATGPLVLHHFHLLSPAGLVTNLAAVPAIGLLAVPLGLLGMASAPFSQTAASFFFRGCALTIEAVLEGVRWILSLPLLGGWKLYLSPAETTGLFLLLLALLLPRICAGRRWPRRLAAATGVLLLLLPAGKPAQLRVTALSVGHGDATVLSGGDGRHYLVDGGGSYGDAFDVGERLVAPALGRMGIRALEAVILTHDHPDHRKGLLHILENFPVGAFYAPVAPEQLHRSIAEVLRRREIPCYTPARGWTLLEKSEKGAIHLFSPPQQGENLNDRSLVLYARQGRQGVLLTGDLESKGVGELLATEKPGPVTLLKLPHHGSGNSSTELLLDRFDPEAAFVSVGAGRGFDLPEKRLLEELRRREIPLYRTDLDGSIRLVAKKDRWLARRWEEGLFR